MLVDAIVVDVKLYRPALSERHNMLMYTIVV